MVSDNEHLYVKAKYGNDIRKVVLCRNDIIHLDNVERWARATFDITEDLIVQIKYVDSDGDLVTLTNDEDVRVALKTESSIYFHVFSNGEDLRAEVARINQEITSVKNMLDKLSLLLEEKTVHFEVPAAQATGNSTSALSAADEDEKIATIHPSVHEQVFVTNPPSAATPIEGLPVQNGHFETSQQEFHDNQFESSPYPPQFGAPPSQPPSQLPPTQGSQFTTQQFAQPPSGELHAPSSRPPSQLPPIQGSQFTTPSQFAQPPSGELHAPSSRPPSQLPPTQGSQFTTPQFARPPSGGLQQGPPPTNFAGEPPSQGPTGNIANQFGRPPMTQVQRQFPSSNPNQPAFGQPANQGWQMSPDQGSQFTTPPQFPQPPSGGFQIPPLGPPPTNFAGGPPSQGPTGNIANPFARPPMAQAQRPGGYNY
uniref:PB1 domain-containing protein n=1 Tax=Panagrolaimus sp. JU765 TaxID=591449 RepID=A0AC34R4T2_9BILA